MGPRRGKGAIRTVRTSKKRKQRNRRRRWRTVVALVTGLVAVGAFLYYFESFLRTSDRFRVRHVVIYGTERLTEGEILDHAGISQEDNVLFFDVDGMAKRIESLPYVKTCRVTVTFPDTVVLDIDERKPFLSLAVNSRVYELDRDGVVLREYEPNEIPVAPLVSQVPDLQFVAVGSRLQEPALEAAIALWQAYRDDAADEPVTVSELAARAENDIRMYCDELPYELRWGRGDFGAQVRRLRLFWRQTDYGAPCTDYLDLRFGRDLACL